MLSILIPVYNIDCTPLINSLTEQINALDISCEIICIDDASTKVHKNSQLLNSQQLVSFYSLSKNIGRSKIRNILAQKAQYNWLLFLDADTLPTKPDYISKYIALINTSNLVVFGGLAYRKKDIVGNSYLRYTYGKHRESNEANKRNITPYNSLLFSNTLIKKSVFDRVKFNQQITKYGHEDSLFSQDLKRQKIKVLHIDNPVFHTGLEDDHIFLEKTKIAIDNLWDLYKNSLIDATKNRLLTYYFKTKNLYLRPVFATIYRRMHKGMEKQLSSNKPSMLLFDFYKLTYLSYITYHKKQIL